MQKFLSLITLVKKILINSLVWTIILLLGLFETSNHSFTLWFINLLGASFLTLIFAFITNNLTFSIITTLFLTTSLYLASFFKVNYLTSLLTIEDLNFLSHFKDFAAFDLIKAYLTAKYFVYFIIFIGLLSYIFIYAKPLFYKNSSAHYPKLTYWRNRALMIISAYGLGYLCWLVLTNPNTFISRQLASIKEERSRYCQVTYPPNQPREKVLCSYIGPFSDIAYTLSNINLGAGITLTDSTKILNAISAEQSPKIPVKPDIILILNESTFNPAYLDYNFSKSLRYNFFDDPLYTKAKGILKVHTIGGGSSISEYPSVTGIVHSVFKGPVNYPFITMTDRTRVSLFKELKKNGYYTIVVYPVDKKFVNAENAYLALGIDRIVDLEDYNFKPDKWRDVPDRIIAEIITKELERAPTGVPVFVYSATMLNHGPHDPKQPDLIHCQQELNNKSLCGKLNDYINRLESTDRDFMKFSEQLMQRSRPTMFFNFGDHLPSFEGRINKLNFAYYPEKNTNYYSTFYNIRANFDLNNNYSYPIMDISFIPSVILDIAGITVGKFYQASSYIRQQCNGLFYECEKEKQDLLESYKALMIEQLGFTPIIIK